MYDDEFQVIYNSDIKHVTAENIIKMFSSSTLEMYQPMVSLSFMIEYALWQLNPGYYHIMNLCWHFVCLVALYLILRYLNVDNQTRFFTVLIFGIAPINVEPVAWISARSTLMYSAFYLIALLFLLKFKTDNKPSNLIYALLFATLSFLSKVTGITFIILALIVLFNELKSRNRDAILYVLSLGLISSAFFIVGIYFRPTESIVSSSLLLDPLRNLIWYISSVFPTIRYSLIYPQDIFSPMRLLPGVMFIALSIVLYFNLKTRTILIRAWVFGLVVILPFLFINTYKSPVNDRYAYLFSFAIILIAVVAIRLLLHKYRSVLFGTVFILFGLISYKTINNWEYNVPLWDNASRYERNFRAYEQYIKVLTNSGEIQKADSISSEYLDLYPKFDEMKVIRAFTLYKAGNYHESATLLDQVSNPALQSDILCLKAYNLLGQNKAFSASQLIEEAIAINSNNGEYYYVKALANKMMMKTYCEEIKKATQLNYRVAEDYLKQCNN